MSDHIRQTFKSHTKLQSVTNCYKPFIWHAPRLALVRRTVATKAGAIFSSPADNTQCVKVTRAQDLERKKKKHAVSVVALAERENATAVLTSSYEK